jgi:hypothetical protein
MLRKAFEIGAPALDAREFFRGAGLAPSDAAGTVVNESRVGQTIADQAFLFRAVIPHSRVGPTRAFGMESHAPAAAPDAVVPFDKPGEIRPSAGTQWFRGKFGQRRPLCSYMVTKMWPVPARDSTIKGIPRREGQQQRALFARQRARAAAFSSISDDDEPFAQRRAVSPSC